MWYYVTIIRNSQTFYVVSPAWGMYRLSDTKDKNTYLWSSEESARGDVRWHHLIETDDEIKIVRTY